MDASSRCDLYGLRENILFKNIKLKCCVGKRYWHISPIFPFCKWRRNLWSLAQAGNGRNNKVRNVVKQKHFVVMKYCSCLLKYRYKPVTKEAFCHCNRLNRARDCEEILALFVPSCRTKIFSALPCFGINNEVRNKEMHRTSLHDNLIRLS